ncbi:hypothetical protein GCM10019071_17080 [Sphingobium fuliginis]|uniref:Uncharacterized protein n=3 Tax=Sphingobium fuliginis (strain ATCC 27551) TaxID=336203 RepID=A0ABQ1EVK8_SPHSA|nr:hypothetical protein GCM10019071_17080 [Sphingobium fuliginis]
MVGTADMIDLSPQPQDKGSGAKAAPAAPQHDPVQTNSREDGNPASWWHVPQEQMEGAIQRLSRWAGPFALLATLFLLGWWIIG